MQIFAGQKFNNPVKTLIAFDSESFLEAFSQMERLRKGHFLLGYVRYEARDVFLRKKIKSEYPLLYFEVYDSPPVPFIQEEADQKGRDSLYPVAQIDYPTYELAIEAIKSEIARGNTYQVNYTYDYKVFSQEDSFSLYNRLLGRQITPYNAYIKNEFEEILSFSPELFFEIEGEKIFTKPMKGTVKRGKSGIEDFQNIEFLKNDEKNRAENVMIVDLLRNDLGKIAQTGSVNVDSLFEIETHKTLHQMTSKISAKLKNEVTLYEIFEALFPCGSVTGAPKINTMQIIDELEIGSRGVYCGAIGLISPEKTVFSVPIRILQRKNQDDFYTYRVGGAIVWDSTAQDEWEETFVKSNFLRPDFKILETILVQNGEFKFKDEHFARMKNAAENLGFVFNKEILALTPVQDGICRILLSNDGSIEVENLPIEPIKTNRVSLSGQTVSGSEPLLFFKTTFRPWYDGALAKIRAGEVFDEIFFNEKGNLCEGARSNLILQIGEKFYTPPLSCGLLNGVFRQKLLDADYPCEITNLQEKNLTIDDLKQAQKVFCVNSVRGVVEVEVDFNR